MATDLTKHYVLLNPDGASITTQGGNAFWSQSPDQLDAYGRGWLVSEYEFASDWKQWEMHPEADELLRVIAGETELQLEWPTGIQSVILRADQAYVVPRASGTRPRRPPPVACCTSRWARARSIGRCSAPAPFPCAGAGAGLQARAGAMRGRGSSRSSMGQCSMAASSPSAIAPSQIRS